MTDQGESVIDRASLQSVGPSQPLRPSSSAIGALKRARIPMHRVVALAASAIAIGLLLFGTSVSAQGGPSMRKLTLPQATLNTFYSYNVGSDWYCGSNASPVFSFLWQSSATVPGLTFPSNGAISGTPTLAGIYTLTGTVTDISGRPGACSGLTPTTYTIEVLASVPGCSIARAPAGSVSAGTKVTLTAT